MSEQIQIPELIAPAGPQRQRIAWAAQRLRFRILIPSLILILTLALPGPDSDSDPDAGPHPGQRAVLLLRQLTCIAAMSWTQMLCRSQDGKLVEVARPQPLPLSTVVEANESEDPEGADGDAPATPSAQAAQAAQAADTELHGCLAQPMEAPGAVVTTTVAVAAARAAGGPGRPDNFELAQMLALGMSVEDAVGQPDSELPPSSFSSGTVPVDHVCPDCLQVHITGSCPMCPQGGGCSFCGVLLQGDCTCPPCWVCGQQGHWAAACPLALQADPLMEMSCSRCVLLQGGDCTCPPCWVFQQGHWAFARPHARQADHLMETSCSRCVLLQGGDCTCPPCSNCGQQGHREAACQLARRAA